MRISDWSSDVCSSDLLRSIMERGMTCGRLGGDEFAIVLPNVPGAKEAEDLAHRIIATLSRPYVVDNHQLFVGASVGYAMGPQDGATVETLTRNRSEEHTSELQSLMRISYAVFCLKK